VKFNLNAIATKGGRNGYFAYLDCCRSFCLEVKNDVQRKYALNFFNLKGFPPNVRSNPI
jgi:hypothetical protein